MKWLLVLFALILATPLYALEPGEALENPIEEARARALMVELRCLVCQNETIEASPAPFASEVRTLVREHVAAGRSNDEIKTYLTNRYGDAILFRPRMGATTWLLWLAPLFLLGIGMVLVVISVRGGQSRRKEQPLSEKEMRQLRSALNVKDDPQP